MMTRIRRRPAEMETGSTHRIPATGTLGIWRGGGLGDMIFLEPALRRLKAMTPGRELLLHAPRDYEDLWKKIGFDRFEVNDYHGKVPGSSGIDLYMGVERHAGWCCLDRVSIWEDMLGLAISDVPVSVDFWPSAKDDLMRCDCYKRGLPFVYFSPFTSSAGLAGRSLTVSHTNKVIGALSKEYNVVMIFKSGPPHGLDMKGVINFSSQPFGRYYSLVASCDLALANDSGGLWVSGAAGVPSVGLFDHVQPWLRARRFPSVFSLSLRWPTCKCHHHGSCTCPQDGEAPCKEVDPEVLLDALQECPRRGGRIGTVQRGVLDRAPGTAVCIVGDGDARKTEVSVREAFRGLDLRFGEAQPGDRYALDLQAGTIIRNRDVWLTLSALEAPDPPGHDLPLPIRRIP